MNKDRYAPPKENIPKKLPAINDVTGAVIATRSTNQDAYASGWDAIWGNKASQEALNQTPSDENAQDSTAPHRDDENASKDVLRGNDAH
jgi:hypothetical protein